MPSEMKVAPSKSVAGPARLRIAVRLDPQPFAQGSIDEFSPAIIPPDADVVVDRLPRREVVGQEAPVTAGL